MYITILQVYIFVSLSNLSSLLSFTIGINGIKMQWRLLFRLLVFLLTISFVSAILPSSFYPQYHANFSNLRICRLFFEG